jgi:hypothetical protein
MASPATFVKRGVTDKENRFAAVWPTNEVFFNEVRSKGGLVSVSVDPLSSHLCGNQRYFAIPWLGAQPLEPASADHGLIHQKIPGLVRKPVNHPRGEGGVS